MRKQDSLSIGDLYGDMLNGVKKSINESVGSGGKDLKDKKACQLDKGGPSEKSGYKKALNDDKEDEEPEEDEETLENKKVSKQRLNTFMSRKSVFDKLYEQVISENFGYEDAENEDIDALGLGDATPDSDLDDDFGGEDDLGDEGDTVTLTIDRATAQTLMDLLQTAIGGGEDDMGDEGDFGGEGDGLDFEDEGDIEGEDEEGDDEDESYDEDEEVGATKSFPDKKKAMQAKKNAVKGKVKPKSGKASAEVTDEVGTKTGMSTSYNDGKNNKVAGKVTKGKDFFNV
jgi:hypothetical protein